MYFLYLKELNQKLKSDFEENNKALNNEIKKLTTELETTKVSLKFSILNQNN